MVFSKKIELECYILHFHISFLIESLVGLPIEVDGLPNTYICQVDKTFRQEILTVFRFKVNGESRKENFLFTFISY